MNPEARIGSDSSEGEVYRVAFQSGGSESQGPTILAAFKLIPILSASSDQKNLREIEIAKHLSRSVIDGRSPYFPIVYGSGYCPSVQYYLTSKFENQATEYAQSLILRNKYPRLSRRIETLQRVKPIGDILRLLDLHEDTTEKSFSSPDLPVHFLVSELAHEDLLSWCRQSHSEIEWTEMFNHLESAVHDLHTLGVHHADLHLGNVLVLRTETEALPLIHDFGKSEWLSDDPVEKSRQIAFDIDKLVGSLEQIGAPIQSDFFSYRDYTD